jgi:hypothetical protein
MGIPAARVGVADSAWRFKGFSRRAGPQGPEAPARMTAGGPGAEAVLTFSGTAVSITGGISPAGGRADVYLDGKPASPIDAYAGARTHDNALWHTYGLPPGTHVLRIVTRADADPRSTGTDISLFEAVVYRGGP